MAWWNTYAGMSPHDKFATSKERMRMAGLGADTLGTVMGLSPDDKKEMEFILGGTPIVGDILGMRDSYNQMNDYLRNRGMSWSDIKYPSKTPFSSGGGIGGRASRGVNFVSKNIMRLYR